MISQDQALEIAKSIKSNNFELYGITHGIPQNCRIYNSNKWVPDDVWCVLCAAYPGQYMIGPNHAIVISKDTGEILFNGLANDEG